MLSGHCNVQVDPAAPATTVVLEVSLLLDESPLSAGLLDGGVLLASCGSGVSLDVLAVLEMVVPAAVAAFTL
jgi:hypothetical protein